MLPIRFKPEHNYNYNSLVTEIPNALSNDHIKRLREFAESADSGLHRRGSKNPNITASFYTTQITTLSDPVYEILNPLWEQYIALTDSTIDFVEPYEIKSYIKYDEFDFHYDTYINLSEKIDRKLNLIIQMSDSDEYEGGDLIVGDYYCTRAKGSAIFFPASLVHQVTRIVSGNRYSLIGHGWGPYLI